MDGIVGEKTGDVKRQKTLGEGDAAEKELKAGVQSGSALLTLGKQQTQE
ncbi:hypothetical protein [Nitrosospira sp. NpAV]|nr:hypothetical protein [Nitrosospira sp. NpAV]